MDWVSRGTDTLKDGDEINRREFGVCNGWECVILKREIFATNTLSSLLGYWHLSWQVIVRERVDVYERERERERERNIKLLIDTLRYYLSLFSNYYVGYTLGPHKLQGNKLQKKREGTGNLWQDNSFGIPCMMVMQWRFTHCCLDTEISLSSTTRTHMGLRRSTSRPRRAWGRHETDPDSTL